MALILSLINSTSRVMADIRLNHLQPRSKGSNPSRSSQATRPLTTIHGQTEIHDAETEADFLRFVHLLTVLRIPNFNNCILNAGTGLAASGTLGKRAQYVVDRVDQGKTHKAKNPRPYCPEENGTSSS
jgi:hypothetical protein